MIRTSEFKRTTFGFTLRNLPFLRFIRFVMASALRLYNFAEGEMVELKPEQKAFFTRWAALSVEQKEMLMNLITSIK